MKEFRNPKGVTAHYTSFEELRKGFGLPELRKRTNDEAKLKAQKEKFLGNCPYCKGSLSYVGGNVVACKNESCKGKKFEKENEDGTKTVVCHPYYKLLNDNGSEIAGRLFGY